MNLLGICREREREREKSSDRSPLHHTLCSLASYTHALIIIFFFFFLGPVVQPQQCVLLYLSISLHLYVFLFLVGVFVCWVGLVVYCWVWTSLRFRNFGWILKLFTEILGLEVHKLPKFQFWNWNLKKKQLKKTLKII